MKKLTEAKVIQIRKLYEEGKTITQIANVVGLSRGGVWKRLKKQGVKMRGAHTRKGHNWGIEKRGKEFLGADGRYWIRGIQGGTNRNSKRRAVVKMEEKIKGAIPKGTFVHHKDGNCLNDNIENLALMSIAEHNRLHNKERWSGMFCN